MAFLKDNYMLSGNVDMWAVAPSHYFSKKQTKLATALANFCSSLFCLPTFFFPRHFSRFDMYIYIIIWQCIYIYFISIFDDIFWINCVGVHYF